MREDASNATPRVVLLPARTPGPNGPPLGEWHRHGLCVGEDPDVFFPSQTGPDMKAREICAACPVISECLDYATQADEYGIWGGMDQQERRSLKRRRQRRQAGRYGQGLESA